MNFSSPSIQHSVQTMTSEIVSVLDGQVHSVWLYGSLVLDDFRPGWSDIDFIAFTAVPLSEKQGKQLLSLRQTLSERFPDDPYYRSFEGVILPLPAYLQKQESHIVYWGTSGQRFLSRYEPDAFSLYELSRFGKSVYGSEDREIFPCPEKKALVSAVRHHYETIRKYAAETNESLYSCGWLLDIARCVYTLRTGSVIGKTQAGQWAMREHLFPDEDALERTLGIRKNPLKYKSEPETRAWLCSLGPVVQSYADVLERELEKETE